MEALVLKGIECTIRKNVAIGVYNILLKKTNMDFIKTKSTSTSNALNIFYQEYGTGNPVILIHGWPLNSEMWEYQLAELPKHNLRGIAYARTYHLTNININIHPHAGQSGRDVFLKPFSALGLLVRKSKCDFYGNC